MAEPNHGSGDPGPGEAPPPDAKERRVLDRIESFRRRRPRLTDEVITLAHGAGGKASAALIDAVFLEAFSAIPDGDGETSGNGDGQTSGNGDGGEDGHGAASPAAGGPGGRDAPLLDAATLDVGDGGRIAFTTDSFVVRPHTFPGGSIGDLAVNGTVNDLAMAGARPRWLAAAFVLEEGFAIAELRTIAADMAAAAARAGVTIVTGDTKVVERGAADGAYVTTTGVGIVPPGRTLGPEKVQAGDVVLVSGTIGDHGMAVMLARGDLALEADIRSDSAPLGELVEALMAAAPGTRWLRDATRGGLGTVANELAHDTDLGVVLDEALLPIDPAVGGACDILGIDPLYVANEGKLVAIVAPDEADAALAALTAHPLGVGAARIGEVVADPAGVVVLRTSFGGTRIVDMLVGDPLPRIC